MSEAVNLVAVRGESFRPRGSATRKGAHEVTCSIPLWSIISNSLISNG